MRGAPSWDPRDHRFWLVVAACTVNGAVCTYAVGHGDRTGGWYGIAFSAVCAVVVCIARFVWAKGT